MFEIRKGVHVEIKDGREVIVINDKDIEHDRMGQCDIDLIDLSPEANASAFLASQMPWFNN